MSEKKKPREIKVILLGLLDDLEKNCQKAKSKKKVQRDEFSLGYVSGEIVIIGTFRKLIKENI